MGAPSDPDDAFSQYVRQVRPALRHRAHVLCGDWYEADDLVQDTLMILSRKWHVVERSAARAAYARTVMVHLLFRQRQSLQRVYERAQDPLPDLPAQPDEIVHAVDRLTVTLAVDALPARQRLVVVLHYWYGLDTGEVARILASPRGTVRSQLARALASLRSMLRDAGQAP